MSGAYQLSHKEWETLAAEIRYCSDPGRYRLGRDFSGRVLQLEGGAQGPAIKIRRLWPQISF